MNPMTLPCNTSPPARQTGLSLVELMISLTIGLVLLLGISTLIVQQSSSRSEMEKSGRQIENGRYAMQLLHDDIQLSGFYDGYSPASGVAITTTNPCDTTNNTANLGTTGNLGWINNAAAPFVPVPIFGYAGAITDPTPTTCLNNYQANTAVLVIRRASTVATAASLAVADNAAAVAAVPPRQPTTYLQVSKCKNDTTPFVLGTSGYTLFENNCTTLASVRPYIVRIYYISRCSGNACANNTAVDIPTLKMEEFVGGTRSTVPLAEGIENMQLDYGIDTSGDGAPDSYTPTLTAANAPNVMTVRVNLLARNNEATTGYADSKTYNLGAVTIAATNDKFKRHAYSQLVRAINPSGRRE